MIRISKSLFLLISLFFVFVVFSLFFLGVSSTYEENKKDFEAGPQAFEINNEDYPETIITKFSSVENSNLLWVSFGDARGKSRGSFICPGHGLEVGGEADLFGLRYKIETYTGYREMVMPKIKN